MPARWKGKRLRSTKWLRDEEGPHLHIAFPVTAEEGRGSWQRGVEIAWRRDTEAWSTAQGSDGQDGRRAKGQQGGWAVVVKRGWTLQDRGEGKRKDKAVASLFLSA